MPRTRRRGKRLIARAAAQARARQGDSACPPPFVEWEGAILLSFFGVYGLSRGLTAVAAAMLGRR